MTRATTAPVHLAVREAPYGGACGAQHGTFSTWATAVTCAKCRKALDANAKLASNVGHPDALTTVGKPVREPAPAKAGHAPYRPIGS